MAIKKCNDGTINILLYNKENIICHGDMTPKEWAEYIHFMFCDWNESIKDANINVIDASNCEKEPDVYDILVFAGVFKSRGEAKKNWRGEDHLSYGLSELKVKRGSVWVLKPVWKVRSK